MNATAKTIEHETGQEIALESNQLARHESATPMQMLSAAMERGVDPEQLDKLLALQERYEKNEARKAYYEARAAFAKNPPKVVKDKTNSQYGSRYSSIENFVSAVVPGLSPHGLSASWTIDQSNGISVTCVLTHEAGHSESVTISGPPDTSGSKNQLQQIKSTITYLKLATLEAITGIASEVGNLSDDGNGAGKKPDPNDEPATEEQIAKIAEWRDAGKISDKTEAWIKKASPLTVGQATHLLNELKVRNPS